jgi:hypothetical protein
MWVLSNFLSIFLAKEKSCGMLEVSCLSLLYFSATGGNTWPGFEKFGEPKDERLLELPAVSCLSLLLRLSHGRKRVAEFVFGIEQPDLAGVIRQREPNPRVPLLRWPRA